MSTSSESESDRLPAIQADLAAADSGGLVREEASVSRVYTRSTIAFPYADLKDAAAIAETVHGEYGGQCSVDQLAASLGQSMRSGAFRTKVSSAQMFGVVENERGRLHLTARGRRLVDSTTRQAALAEAFLAVDLYRMIFEKHLGGVLPRDAGLEAEMADLGVAPKQAERARQAMQRSADVAGFFRLGRERLVAPPSAAVDNLPAVNTSAVAEQDQGAQPPVTALHPLLAGLMQELPAEGSDFPADRRRDWLDAAQVIFRLVYGKPEQDDH